MISRSAALLRAGAAAALVLAALALPPAADAVLVDRIVAAVNNEIIALSDLRQAVAFNEALGGARNGKRIEAETLEGLINRRLLLQEAYRLKFAEVSPQDAAAEVGKLRQRLGSEDAFRAFLARTGMNEEQLTRMLGERLLVERFVEKKIALFARVSRDEAQRYYAGHPDTYRGRPFPEVQSSIIALLTAQKVDQQLDQYITELRERARIRINPLDEGGSPAPHPGEKRNGTP